MDPSLGCGPSDGSVFDGKLRPGDLKGTNVLILKLISTVPSLLTFYLVPLSVNLDFVKEK